MPRRIMVAVFVVGLVLAAGSSLATTRSAFGGGGGCPEPQSDAHGTHVDVKEFCMLPTVIRVDEGATITWQNWDEAPHTVSGAPVRSGSPGAGSWGSFEQLAQNQTFAHTFNDPGVYPYYCFLHPGMVGAVVVGDGLAEHPYAPGSGVVSASDSSGGAAQTSRTQQSVSSSGGGTDWKSITLIALGSAGVAVAGAFFAYRRLRTLRHSPTGATE